MCESPSDLLLTGKVLAATTRGVDPAICHRHGGAEWKPSWQTGWCLAGPWKSEEGLQVQHRWSQGIAQTRSFFLCPWDMTETKATGEPGEMFCCSGRMLG